jgi:OHCU decarboxylase
LTTPRLPPIDELNTASREGFISALGVLFEAAAPLADALYERRPYDSYNALLQRAEIALDDLPPEKKIEVVNAHPRIGESPEALRRTSALSYREQGYASESTPDEREIVKRRLAQLNQAYEQRHGFRFVVFVNRRPKSDIIKVMEWRMRRSRQDELATALQDIVLIARDRLQSLQP